MPGAYGPLSSRAHFSTAHAMSDCDCAQRLLHRCLYKGPTVESHLSNPHSQKEIPQIRSLTMMESVLPCCHRGHHYSRPLHHQAKAPSLRACIPSTQHCFGRLTVSDSCCGRARRCQRKGGCHTSAGGRPPLPRGPRAHAWPRRQRKRLHRTCPRTSATSRGRRLHASAPEPQGI